MGRPGIIYIYMNNYFAIRRGKLPSILRVEKEWNYLPRSAQSTRNKPPDGYSNYH